MNKNGQISRRDVLKAALVAGGAAALAPFLHGCAGVQTPAPKVTAAASPALSPAANTADQLAGLSGLNIDSFFQEAYRRWMARDPENLTALGLADLWGVGNGDLTDISDAHIRETQALETGTLALLRGYDRSALNASQALTAEVFDWFLEDLTRGHAFMYADYPVSPVITSIPYNLYMLFTVYQPLNGLHAARDYVSRLEQVGPKLEQLMDGLQRREQRGVILPSIFFGYVLPDIDQLAQASPSAHPYFNAFSSRLTGVSDEERKALAAKILGVIQQTVRPAYGQLSTFLNGQQARASKLVGVWQFSDGEDYYAQCLRRHTTTELTADQIHQLGLDHVTRIHEEMRQLFASLGYPVDESIPQLIRRLTASSGVYQGQSTVTAYEQAVSQAEALLPQAFARLPRSRVKVVGGKDGDYYMPAAFDGSRPGLFFARTNGSLPRFGVRTTGFHETVPGHHLQIALVQETPGLPDLRRGMQFNAYTEGWALYAERLMSELGAYADDPMSDLGRLQMEAYRAARLVVDTGIHDRRWSFSRAVDYLMEATGFPAGYAQGEVSRYCVWPGQATSYYVGFLKLLELRQKAREALGSRFDLKAFHHAVLGDGSMPLPLLERVVLAYIKAQP